MEGHEGCPGCRSQLSRRSALKIAAGAGAAAVVAPRLQRWHAHEAGTDLGNAASIAARRPDWPAPTIITRAQWGANEAMRKGGQEYDSVVEKIVVHHTGTPNPVTDGAAHLRGIYATAVAGEYIDVQYNWLIDPAGNIYEGRWATDYPAGAVHTGELNAQNVRGGHAERHNSRTIGIAIMGDYSNISPSDAAMSSLLTLLTWKCARWGIDPTGASPYVNSVGATESIANICSHRETKQAFGDGTTCPGDPLINQLPGIRAQIASRLADGSTGYWIAAREGRLFAFGSLPDQGDTRRLGLPAQIIGVTAHPSGLGYWLVGRDGGVFTFGAAQFFGSTGGIKLNSPMIGMASTHDGAGYWLVAGDGGVFSFGNARFYGSMGGFRLNSPVLGLCPTPSGAGYWLYARDGGIFSFGDARFFGSTGGMRLNQPIVTMAARPQGDGYWLVAADGGVFSFGNAQFYGSGAGYTLRGPVVGMIPTTTGRGYLLVVRDGGVLAFGDAPFLGSAAGRVTEAVGVAGRLTPF
jgi:hypothetical protein